MISDSEQRRIARDLRVVANGARLPGWIFLAITALLVAAFLLVSALRFVEVYWRALTRAA
jgi:hypothetical protein